MNLRASSLWTAFHHDETVHHGVSDVAAPLPTTLKHKTITVRKITHSNQIYNFMRGENKIFVNVSTYSPCLCARASTVKSNKRLSEHS